MQLLDIHALSNVTQRGRVLAHAFYGEIEKIAEASTAQEADAGPGEQKKDSHETEEEEQNTDDEMLENATPVQKAVGHEIEMIEKDRARGVPIIPPPPGFVYRQDLASFAPDMTDPGWQSGDQAQQAEANQRWFAQGQEHGMAAGAQANLDGQIEGALQAAQQAQAAAQMGGQPGAPGQPGMPQAGGAQPPQAPPVQTPNAIAGGKGPKMQKTSASRPLFTRILGTLQ